MKEKNIKKSGSGQTALNRPRQGFAVGTLALVIVIVLLASYGVIQMTERRAHASAEKLVSEVVEHIDNKMEEVRLATLDAAEKAKGMLDDPDALEQLTRDFVSRNEFIYGSTVAFEPDVFPDRGRCFAPYSWRTPDGEVHDRQLGTETDYYQEEWYAETKLSEEEYWCEPYFDEGGAKIMMCTFSIPLKDMDGRFTAIMTADVGLDDLEDYISSISPYPDSYIVLRSQKGNVLANAKSETKPGNDTIIIKGVTETGWSVELSVPFIYLMHGDTGMFFFIGTIFLITILFVYFANRMLTKIQQDSSAEYMNVIDAISSSFSSIFLVNLTTDETVIIREPEKYAQTIGPLSEENRSFTDRLTKMIRSDCERSDRERMLGEIALETIHGKLTGQDRYEVRFRKESNGVIRWYEMEVFAMERDESGTPSRAVVAFTDVNESVQKEKEAQETLEKALAEAESASKAKTDFLFNMSHDIRTPMNAIIGFTNMARKHVDEKEKVLDCLNKTQQSGNLLLALINSVLDISRIEAGQAKIEESPADVEYSFTAIENTMTELAAARDIDISFSIGNIVNKYVFCDIDRCNRIFVNIISNAIKYTHEGGTIRISCEQIESTREGYGCYRYIFEDNGIGMSEEFQKNVFEQFTRERTSTVSGIQGSGLGLAVCKSFVDLMDGTIECRSRQNEGTTFTVDLPFRIQDGKRYIDPYTREEVSAYEKKKISQPAVIKGRKVLLVEDNELNLEIAEEILEEEGLIVETANDGLEAVRIMREKGPDYYDFILMDIQMPVMNGYEATKEIRKMYPDSDIPIIAISANAFEEDRHASREAGMNDHVAKPIIINELFTILAKYM